MEIAQQFSTAPDIFVRDGFFFLFDVGLQGANFGGRDIAHKLPCHLDFQHAPDCKDLFGFVRGGRCHKSAARRLHSNQFVLGELKQRLSDQGPGHPKVRRQFLLSQLGAGHQPMLNNGFGQSADNGVC